MLYSDGDYLVSDRLVYEEPQPGGTTTEWVPFREIARRMGFKRPFECTPGRMGERYHFPSRRRYLLAIAGGVVPTPTDVIVRYLETFEVNGYHTAFGDIVHQINQRREAT